MKIGLLSSGKRSMFLVADEQDVQHAYPICELASGKDATMTSRRGCGASGRRSEENWKVPSDCCTTALISAFVRRTAFHRQIISLTLSSKIVAMILAPSDSPRTSAFANS